MKYSSEVLYLMCTYIQQYWCEVTAKINQLVMISSGFSHNSVIMPPSTGALGLPLKSISLNTPEIKGTDNSLYLNYLYRVL